jgi:hypothetical protein
MLCAATEINAATITCAQHDVWAEFLGTSRTIQEIKLSAGSGRKDNANKARA